MADKTWAVTLTPTGSMADVAAALEELGFQGIQKLEMIGTALATGSPEQAKAAESIEGVWAVRENGRVQAM